MYFKNKQFSEFQIKEDSYLLYKGKKHLAIAKDNEEKLLKIVESTNGEYSLWKAKWVRFENCIILKQSS